ncbi:MAG TPA: hypothetical protein VM077_03565 [Candidatus Limnocylindrales bacterium]|nr:hypothetical protein [Candidatus Limnocylindrales bacterium]
MGAPQERNCEALITYTTVRRGQARYEILKPPEGMELNSTGMVANREVISGIEEVCINCGRCGIDNVKRRSSDNKHPWSAAVGAERLAAQVLEDQCQPFQPLKELGLKPNKDFHPMLTHIK